MKYLEGNIFLNFYIFGAAGIIAVLIGGILYSKFDLKFTYILSFNMCIIGCIGLLAVQLNLFKFDTPALKE